MTSRAVSPAPSSSNTVTRPSSPVPHIRLRIPRDLYLVELAFAGSPYIWSLCDSIHAIYTLRRYELLLTDEETERVKARVKALLKNIDPLRVSLPFYAIIKRRCLTPRFPRTGTKRLEFISLHSRTFRLRPPFPSPPLYVTPDPPLQRQQLEQEEFRLFVE